MHPGPLPHPGPAFYLPQTWLPHHVHPQPSPWWWWKAAWWRTPHLINALLPWVATVVGLAGAMVLLVVQIDDTPSKKALLSAALSCIPVALLAPVLVWLCPGVAGHRWARLLAFTWGSTGAVVLAIGLSQAAHWIYLATGGPTETLDFTVLPLIEEICKTAGIVPLWFLAKRRLTALQAATLCALMGLGFAFMENILYLANAFTSTEAPGGWRVFFLRCLVSPFLHPLCTGVAGLGIGFALNSRHPWTRRVLPVVLCCIGVLLHCIWNASTRTGLGGLTIAFFAVQVPLLVTALAVAWLIRRQNRLAEDRCLRMYQDNGWVTAHEVDAMSGQYRRPHERHLVSTSGKPALMAWDHLRRHVALLAQERSQPPAPPVWAEQEMSLLLRLCELRAHFLRTVQPGTLR